MNAEPRLSEQSDGADPATLAALLAHFRNSADPRSLWAFAEIVDFATSCGAIGKVGDEVAKMGAQRGAARGVAS